MTIPQFSRCLAVALFAWLPNAATAADPPNIVIFITDDLSWHDVACFGGPTDAKTPHLDKLASEGMKLTRFYSPAVVCSPTRQALLTGMYPVRNGAYPNHSVVRDGVRSLPGHLKTLGYVSACLGKTHFGPRASFPFDQFAGMTVAEGKTKGKAKANPADAKGEAKGGGEDADDGDLDVAALEGFIKGAKGKPFFAYLATHEPHSPWTKGPKDRFDPAKLNIPPYMVDTEATRKALAAYYAEVAYLDDQVGAVMATLEKTGHANDTLVLFFSEQGSSMPQGKWTLYDPGIRVAAIARWPGRIKPASESAALMQYVDVAPTLLAAAGADPAKFDTGCPDATGSRAFDGRSFLEILDGKADTLRDVVFAQHTTRGIIRGSELYASRAAFDGRWKLILNLHSDALFQNTISNGSIIRSWEQKGRAGDAFAATQAARYTKRPAVELYDLHADPWELNNVAQDPANAPVIAKLRASLDGWMKQQGDLGDQTEREANQHQGAGRRKADNLKPDPAKPEAAPPKE